MNQVTITSEDYIKMNADLRNLTNECEAHNDNLEEVERLLYNIIDVFKSSGNTDEVTKHLYDKVDKPYTENGISRDTFEYFLDLITH